MMSIFNKLSLLACFGVLVFALSACPPSQEKPAGEAEQVEAPAGTEEVVEEEEVIEEAPAEDTGDTGDTMDDSGTEDGSGAADEGSDSSSN